MFDEMRLINFLERNISENNKLLEEYCCKRGDYRMATEIQIENYTLSWLIEVLKDPNAYGCDAEIEEE